MILSLLFKGRILSIRTDGMVWSYGSDEPYCTAEIEANKQNKKEGVIPSFLNTACTLLFNKPDRNDNGCNCNNYIK